MKNVFLTALLLFLLPLAGAGRVALAASCHQPAPKLARPLVTPSAPRLAKPLVAPSAPAEDWQPLTDMATLTGVTFRLALIDAQEFPGQEAAPSLSFAPGPRLVGELCNRFTGEVEWRDGVLRGNLAMTRRFCLNPDLNRAEQLLSDLLGRGARLEVAPGGRLRLRGDGGILTYRAEPGAPGTALPW